MEDQGEYPRRSVLIAGVPARAMLRILSRQGRAEVQAMEFRTVREAEQAEAALGDPEAEHCCPLCGDILRTLAFTRHAPSCIVAHAPRLRANRDRELPELGDVGKRTMYFAPAQDVEEVAL